MTLRSKLEAAIQAHLTNAGLANVLTGMANADKVGPAIIVACKTAEEDPYLSGNYRVEVEISVRVSAPEPGATDTTFDDLCTQVRAALWTDTSAADIQAAGTDLTVFGWAAPHRMSWEVAEEAQVEKHTVEVYCCPS